MTSYGVTTTGFVKKDLDTIKAELEAALLAQLGDTINLLPTSVFGQLVGIIAEREAEIWDGMEAVYAALYPSSAGGQSLDNVCALTGVHRLQATKGTVTLTCNLNAGVTVPTGSIASQGAGSDVRVVTTADGTNSGGAPADISIPAECEDTGPIAALAGTLEYIETPVTGWNSVTNAADVDPGRDQETDAELRLRRAQLLQMPGNGALDAVVTAVAAVEDVTTVLGFENDTDTTDGDGLPPHSIEILALDGAAQDIVDAIWAAKAGGIATYGSSSGTATDASGGTHTVYYSRPIEVPIHVIIDVTTTDDFPADGAAQIKAAIVAHGDGLTVGEDVVQAALYQNVFAISGVVDVTKIWIGTADPPTGPANIIIGVRQISTWDSTDVDVNVT